MHITHRLENVLIKSSGVQKCSGRWFSDGEVEKPVLHKKWCTKVVSAVGLSGNPFCLESVSFHLEMFDVTNSRLVLVNCNVNVVIFDNNKKMSGMDHFYTFFSQRSL